ncbi:MAG: hypothetical protein IAG10_30050 [Planctomycetaceae bacterium]|nr:hypothetical protein [Planctomycetaceae bacterium]
MARHQFVHRNFLQILIVQFTFAAAFSHAADTTNELLLRVPPSANAVAVVDVEGLFKSKLGTSEGWSRRYLTDYANGMVPFPPSVQTAVLAAKIDTDSIHADWELGLVRLKSPFAMKKLAEKESATLEKLEGHSFVATDRRTSFIELKPQRLAVTNHQNRQDVARWLRGTRDVAKPLISEYLLEAVTDPKGQYHLALDLQDVLQFDDAKLRLQNSPALKGQTVDLDALAKLAVGLRGLRVSIDVGETIEGTLQIDLSDEIAPYASLLPRIALAALQKNGVFIEELSDAKVEFGEKSFTFTSTLSEPSFRRVISLIQPSVGHLDDGSTGSDSPPAPGAVVAEQSASTRFFKTIQTQLNDLETNARKAKNYESSAHWFESYAKKISQLPSRDIDPDLLNYSTSVVNKLRAIARSLRGVPLDVGALQFAKKQEVYVYPTNYYGNGWYGGVSAGAGYAFAQPRYEYKNNFAEVEAKQAKVIADAEKDRQKVWDMLTDETLSTRSRLSRKYGVDL